MFTSVDSNRKKLEHPSNENVQFPQSLNYSIIKESKSGIANQIDSLLSQNDEYIKHFLLHFSRINVKKKIFFTELHFKTLIKDLAKS